jgi:hypothetical protein
MFRNPAINIYSHDVMRLVRFYEGLGFRQRFRTPNEGTPVHVEVALDGFTIGIASVDANLRAAWVADPDGNPIQLVQRR